MSYCIHFMRVYHLLKAVVVFTHCSKGKRTKKNPTYGTKLNSYEISAVIQDK